MTATRNIASNGYVRVHLPGHPMAHAYGWVYEHRMVAYDAGLISPGDGRQVHHKNHDRTDNRLENLEVLTPAAHGREHRRLDWASVPGMYRAGMSTPQIAERIGTAPGNVSRHLAEAGVRARTVEERFQIDVDAIVVMLRAGVPVQRIADHFGHGRTVVTRIARQHGIRVRPGRPSADTPTPEDVLHAHVHANVNESVEAGWLIRGAGRVAS